MKKTIYLVIFSSIFLFFFAFISVFLMVSFSDHNLVEIKVWSFFGFPLMEHNLYHDGSGLFTVRTNLRFGIFLIPFLFSSLITLVIYLKFKFKE